MIARDDCRFHLPSGIEIRETPGDRTRSHRSGTLVRLKKGLKVYLATVITGLLVGAPAALGTGLDVAESARIQFESNALSEPQFLMGAPGGQPVMIWRDLRLPAKRAKHFPAVILSNRRLE
jgi:hypothetical protein